MEGDGVLKEIRLKSHFIAPFENKVIWVRNKALMVNRLKSFFSFYLKKVNQRIISYLEKLTHCCTISQNHGRRDGIFMFKLSVFTKIAVPTQKQGGDNT